MQPKVSMVMPCYNKVKYIGRMLRSVHAQTWDNLELILVDDGSTDGTRDMIALWEPKFKARGFDVVVIDQQNAGVVRAVRSGMNRVTGDYFCCVDCDDLLYPDYVKSMVTALMLRPDCAWVCCDYELVRRDKVYPHENFAARPGDADMMLQYVLLRMTSVSWIYLVRTAYLRECGVTENFVLEPGVSQQPGLVLPLAAGGGKLCVLPDVLIRHEATGSKNGPRYHDGEAWQYFEQLRALVCKVLEKMNIAQQQKERLLDAARLCYTLLVADIQSRSREGRVVCDETMRQALAVAEQLFPAVFPAAGEDFLGTPPHLALRAVGNRLAGLSAEFVPPARVIGYGALGQKARHAIPLSAKTPLAPALLWDTGAAADSRVQNMPVTQPDYDALRPGDAIVLYPVNPALETEVRALVKTPDVAVVSYGEWMDLLAAWYLPLA